MAWACLMTFSHAEEARSAVSTSMRSEALAARPEAVAGVEPKLTQP